MTQTKPSYDDLKPGSRLVLSDDNRSLTYRADRVDRVARSVEGVLMDKRGTIITGFVMSFDSWAKTAERSKAGS